MVVLHGISSETVINLINFGILPLTFADPADYEKIEQGDTLEMTNLLKTLREGKPISVKNMTKGVSFAAKYDLTPRQKEIIIHGGLLNATKSGHHESVLISAKYA